MTEPNLMRLCIAKDIAALSNWTELVLTLCGRTRAHMFVMSDLLYSNCQECESQLTKGSGQEQEQSK